METKFVKTLNNMGFMTSGIDTYTEEFIDYCSPEKLVFESGAAFGIATLPMLAKGANVVVNDLEQKHLDAIVDTLDANTRKRIIPVSGPIQNLSFKNSTFDGIFTCRMLHLLKGKDIEAVLRKFYTWLHPGGIAVIICDTPFIGWFKSNLPAYERRRAQGDKWPGLIADTSQYLEKANNNIPSFINFLDLETLERAVKEVGFILKKSSYIKQDLFPSEAQFDGRESAGVIVQKQ